MKTLITLFGKERSELETELDKATSLDRVVNLLNSRLNNVEKIYIGQLNVAQVRLASLFLDALRQSFATLTAANEIQVALPEPKPLASQATKSAPNRLILKVLQALICIGILGSLFSLTETTPGVWMAILLMSLLAGLEVALQLDKNDGEISSDTLGVLEAPQVIMRFDSKVLLDNLADALSTIDNAVARLEQANNPLGSSGIEELPELLNLIQRLMGAYLLEKPQMAIELTKLLPQVLMEQGIRAQIYRPNDAHSDREYFDFEPSIDPGATDYVTITPALFNGERLLRRGRVIEPDYSEARD